MGSLQNNVTKKRVVDLNGLVSVLQVLRCNKQRKTSEII